MAAIAVPTSLPNRMRVVTQSNARATSGSLSRSISIADRAALDPREHGLDDLLAGDIGKRVSVIRVVHGIQHINE